MLTPDGLTFIRESLLPALADAQMLVRGAGDEVFAQKPLDEGFPKLSDDGESIVFQATFGPETANFEWVGEGVKLGQKVIEWEDKDSGRKALGAIWTVQIAVDVNP